MVTTAQSIIAAGERPADLEASTVETYTVEKNSSAVYVFADGSAIHISTRHKWHAINDAAKVRATLVRYGFVAEAVASIVEPVASTPVVKSVEELLAEAVDESYYPKILKVIGYGTKVSRMGNGAEFYALLPDAIRISFLVREIGGVKPCWVIDAFSSVGGCTESGRLCMFDDRPTKAELIAAIDNDDFVHFTRHENLDGLRNRALIEYFREADKAYPQCLSFSDDYSSEDEVRMMHSADGTLKPSDLRDWVEDAKSRMGINVAKFEPMLEEYITRARDLKARFGVAILADDINESEEG